MDTALFRSHCPELMIDILYGDLTEHGKQFTKPPEIDPIPGPGLLCPSGYQAETAPSTQPHGQGEPE